MSGGRTGDKTRRFCRGGEIQISPVHNHRCYHATSLRFLSRHNSSKIVPLLFEAHAASFAPRKWPSCIGKASLRVLFAFAPISARFSLCATRQACEMKYWNSRSQGRAAKCCHHVTGRENPQGARGRLCRRALRANGQSELELTLLRNGISAIPQPPLRPFG